MSDATTAGGGPDRRRWLILGVIGLAQLMVVLDLTVMNVALPSALRGRGSLPWRGQGVSTAYTLTLRPRAAARLRRPADLLGRKVASWLAVAGFACVSAIGGASVNFAMLITARACQGAFAALLVPSALSLLTSDVHRAAAVRPGVRRLRGDAGAGGAVGLLLGGALTEYLSWRYTLYVNLIFAAVAFTGGALLLKRQPSPVKPRLDIPGVLLVSGAVFALVYGLSNAAAHSWHAPSTWGFLAAAGAALACGLRVVDEPGRPARCCLPGWCSTATAAAPTPRCSSPRPGCSGSSCS